MQSELTVQINGKTRTFTGLTDAAPLADLLGQLDLKADRVAVELNGEIAPRSLWPTLTISEGDKLEIVHFVGGGLTYGLPVRT